MALPENPNPVELLKAFKNSFWFSRGWFVQCRLRDRGRFFRLFTVESPIITTLYWPDDETSLDLIDTIVYPNVTHIELWWNLSRTTHAVCPNVRSIRFYGAENDEEASIHSNILEILQNPAFEHIIIYAQIPINHERFASVLVNSSVNLQKLTCSSHWLIKMLEEKQFEWINLLTTKCIRKLIVTDNDNPIVGQHLISFCRTFINLIEITMKMESKEDLFFLLNTLANLTMVNIELASITLDEITDHRKMIEENTMLDNFVIHKRVTSSDNCNLLLWIDSRRTLHGVRTRNFLYLQNLINH